MKDFKKLVSGSSACPEWEAAGALVNTAKGNGLPKGLKPDLFKWDIFITAKEEKINESGPHKAPCHTSETRLTGLSKQALKSSNGKLTVFLLAGILKKNPTT